MVAAWQAWRWCIRPSVKVSSPGRPGLSGEIEQHCPCDDAVVVFAEQLLR